MTRIRIIGLSAATIFVLTAIAASSAFATELLLSSATSTFKGVGLGSSLLETKAGDKVVCLEGTASGEGTTAHLGKGTILFEKCSLKLLGETHMCTSVGAIEGHVTVPVEFHINLARSSSTGEPRSALLFLVSPTFTFSCGALISVEVKGSMTALLCNKTTGEPLVPTEQLSGARLLIRQNKGKQTDPEFLLALTSPENTIDKAKLEANVDKLGFEESGIEGAGEITETTPTELTLVTG